MDSALRWYLSRCEGGYPRDYATECLHSSYAVRIWRKEIPILLLIQADTEEEYWQKIRDFICQVTGLEIADPYAEFNKFVSDLFTIKFRLQKRAIRNHRILRQYLLQGFKPSHIVFKFPFFLGNNKNFVKFMLACKFDDHDIWKTFINDTDAAYQAFSFFTDISIKEKKWKHIINRIRFLLSILESVKLVCDLIQPRALKLITIISNATVVAPPNYQQELIYMVTNALKIYWQYATKNEFHNALTIAFNSSILTPYYYVLCKFNELQPAALSKKKIVKLICDRGLKYLTDFEIITDYIPHLDSAALTTAVSALYNLGTENEVFCRVSFTTFFTIGVRLGEKLDVRNYFIDCIRKLFGFIGTMTQSNQNDKIVLIIIETVSKYVNTSPYWMQQCFISCLTSLKSSKMAPEYLDRLVKIDVNAPAKALISKRSTLTERCQSTPKIPKLSLTEVTTPRKNDYRPNTSRDKMKMMSSQKMSTTSFSGTSFLDRRKKDANKIPKQLTSKSIVTRNSISKTTELGPSIFVTSIKKL